MERNDSDGMTPCERRVALAERYADALVSYQTLHGEVMEALANDAVGMDDFDARCTHLIERLRELKHLKMELQRRKREADAELST